MRSIVSEKGQVTIPKKLRDRLGIRAGETLDFEDDAGRLVVTKATDRDPVDEVYGILKVEGGTDALMNTLRGDPPA